MCGRQGTQGVLGRWGPRVPAGAPATSLCATSLYRSCPPGCLLAGQCSDLDVELHEGGAPLRPAREAASSPTAAAQKLLAEVRAPAQHQGVVEATPQGDGAPQITHLRTQGQGP